MSSFFLSAQKDKNGLQNRNDCSNGDPGVTPDSFKASDIIIDLASSSKQKPDPNSLVFGAEFTDHMLCIDWMKETGWQQPVIKPFQNLSLHPAVSALHYAIQLFEGLKAYRGEDGKVRLFRPKLNMERMHRSALRMTLPPTLGVRKPSRALLYIILCPVGPYFSSGSFNPVSLWAEPKYVRAWMGGTGDCKVGGNYGPTIFAQYEAVAVGCQQVLWLYGEDEQITEVGTMNLFIFWTNENGEEELVTPPLDGIILPGVTRHSILDLAQQWGEFKVSERHLTMKDLVLALNENRVREMFGAGTACVVCPVSRVSYKNKDFHIPTMENGPKMAKRFLQELTDIQYGRAPSDWMVEVPSP
ncbi:hypothetical protein XELAEV_18019708mg [Xenopus laevis]|uniref:Branched-chain-amino-acid aminotransferase n=1 Tax=Xenopus laevis TaxID=8355 RepID=A0A974HPW5_XENLA|nr:hypothetical protein XELAEV_18019708mg [Xenopus laevis]